jgi:uncharacterized phage protein (TIGR01671 family)
MREIKFRAWDEATNTFFYWDLRQPAKTIFIEPEFSDDIQQYTGLHDKNNREIYEGDIVRRGGESIPEGEWGIVEYTGCSFGLNRENFIKKTGGAQFIDYPEQYFDNDFNWCEVIGNIFENPELLEAQKEGM